jgi:hypothetical protein
MAQDAAIKFISSEPAGVGVLSVDDRTLEKAVKNPDAAIAFTDTLPFGTEVSLVAHSEYGDGDSIFVGAASTNGSALALHFFDAHLYHFDSVQGNPGCKREKLGRMFAHPDRRVCIKLKRAFGGTACRVHFRVDGEHDWHSVNPPLRGDIRVFVRLGVSTQRRSHPGPSHPHALRSNPAFEHLAVDSCAAIQCGCLATTRASR